MSSELSSGPTTPSLPTKKALDGPAPKALPEDTSDVADGMPLNPGDQSVQFISGQDPGNGEAKVEIGDNHGSPKFVGLGKEELMKYANDPFWVRLRWVLFILFWLIWLAMLAGAIVIILYAPKCSDKLEGPKDGPYYQIYLNKFLANGRLLDDSANDGYIKHLRDLGVKTIILSQFVESDSSADISRVVNFTKVDPIHGSIEELTTLIDKLQNDKDRPIKVVIQIIPNHSSIQHPWFQELGTRQEFYVLETIEKANASTWKSRPKLDEPAWTASSDGKNSYLHQFKSDEADLNYANEKVIKEINDVLKFWFEAGASGFLLSDVSYLLEDLDKQQDQAATINHKDNSKVVKELLDFATWGLNGTEPFALLDVDKLSPDQSIAYYTKNIVPVSTRLAELNETFTAEDLKTALEETYQKLPKQAVTWRLSGPRFVRPSKRYGSQDKADALAAVAFMLRGQVIAYYGDEYGIQNSPSDDLDVSQEQFVLSDAINNKDKTQYYSDLFKIHESLNQTNGEGGSSTFHTPNPSVFIMDRSVNEKSYIVAANFGEQEETVDLKSNLGENVASVSVVTPNLKTFKVNGTVSGPTIRLPKLTGIILALAEKAA